MKRMKGLVRVRKGGKIARLKASAADERRLSGGGGGGLAHSSRFSPQAALARREASLGLSARRYR